MGFFKDTIVEENAENTVFESEGYDIEEVLSGEPKNSSKDVPDLPPIETSEEVKKESKKELDKLANVEPKKDVTMIIPDGIVLPNGIEVNGDVCIKSNAVKSVTATNIMLDNEKCEMEKVIAKDTVLVEENACVISDHIECSTINISGAVSGEVKTDNFTLEDNAVFKGNVTASNVNISSSASIMGTINIVPEDQKAFEVFN